MTASGLESVSRERALWESGHGTPRTLEGEEVHRRRVVAGVEGQKAHGPRRRRSTDPRCVPCSEEPLLAMLAPRFLVPPCACSSCALASVFWWEMCEGRSCRGSPPCPLGSCKHPATREQSDMSRRLSTQSRPGRSRRSITRGGRILSLAILGRG